MRALRVGLAAVHVGRGRRVHHQRRSQGCDGLGDRGLVGDVELGTREPDGLMVGERIEQVEPELPSCPGDQDLHVVVPRRVTHRRP